MNQRMVTLQVMRLEMDDGPHFKQYTAFCGNGRHAFFGFSRIGQAWQWSVKNGPDAGRVVLKQVEAKRRKGYEDTWRADVTVPELWADDPAAHARELQDFAEDARRSGQAHSSLETPVVSDADAATPVAAHLSGLLADARRIVTKMAVDPGNAMADYAALVGDVETAKEDLDVAESYLDTLKIMLAAGEAQTA